MYYRKRGGLCAWTWTWTCTEGPGDDRRRWNLAVGRSMLIPAHCVPVLLGTAAQITLHATIVRATKSGLDPRVWHVSLSPEMLMQQCGFSCGPWLHLVTTVLHFVIIDGATLYETHRERKGLAIDAYLTCSSLTLSGAQSDEAVTVRDVVGVSDAHCTVS